jgi:glucose-6-phosphate dehydrogenase assembly protein OpcA
MSWLARSSVEASIELGREASRHGDVATPVEVAWALTRRNTPAHSVRVASSIDNTNSARLITPSSINSSAG